MNRDLNEKQIEQWREKEGRNSDVEKEGRNGEWDRKERESE